MGAQGGCCVAEAGLPEHGQVEQPFDQNHCRALADGVPGKEAALRSRQQTMRKSCSDTAAVQVHDSPMLSAREDYTPAESVAALVVDQASMEQQIERIALGREMTPQSPAGSVANAEFFDDGGIPQSTTFQISSPLPKRDEVEADSRRRSAPATQRQ